MKQKFFQALSLVRYWLDSVDEHSLHSPFLFDLYTRVIKPAKGSATPSIEKFRRQLLDSPDSLEVTDYGAGSLHDNGKFRKVSSIARVSLTTPKYAALYRSLVLEYRAKKVIELGTSLGITTLYLSPPGTQTITFEGAGAIAQVASRIFQEAGSKNIEIVVGNIDTTLPEVVTRTDKVDVLFMDAHHRYEATLRYFNVIEPLLHSQSVAIIDDIHYSSEMEQAWMFFKNHPRVFATVDLFRCGLVFFDPSLNRQHVVLEY